MNLKLILTVAIVAIIGVAVCLYIGYLGYEPFDQFYAKAVELVGGVNMEDLTSNPTAMITTATAGIGAASAVAVPLMSKLNTAKQQVTDTTAAAKSQLDSLSSEKDKLLGTVEDYKTQALTAKDALTAKTQELTDYKASVGDTSKTISNLEAQVKSIQDQNSQFVTNLMTAANGALVTNPVDGKIYSVLKVPPEVHVK